MSSSFDYLDLCRLCLVKDRVTVPIFEAEGDVRQIFLKITACLPVKVSRDDKLPKKICDDCVYKVETFYQFWNTTANAEKQLLQWLCEVGGLEDKQGYEVLDSNVMKQEQGTDSRLDGNVMQVGGHQNNMDMGMMDNMSLITMSTGSEQQFTSVPMDASGTVQAVPGPSTQTHEVAQSQTGVSHIVEEEEESEEDENSDEGCDNEEGLPVKEETEEGQSDQTLEPTQFVSLPCDEAGPSGLQQQKMAEMSEMTMQQTADGDPKTGYFVTATLTKLTALTPSHDPIVATPKLEMMTPSDESRIITPKLEMMTPTHDSTIDPTKLTILTPSHDIRAAANNEQPHESTIVEQPSLKVFTTEELIAAAQSLNPDEKPDENGLVVVPPEDIFQCTLCGDGFVDENDLEYHLKTHDEPHLHEEVVTTEETMMLFACDRCGQTCGDEDDFHKHQLNHAAEDSITNDTSSVVPEDVKKLYICQFCDYNTPHRQNFVTHQRRHNLEFKYQCENCDAQFHDRNQLQEHMIVHSREKPYLCDICHATFRYRQGLRLHAKLHQPDYVPPQKKHCCEVCNKRFCRKQVLLVHMRTHGNVIPQNEYVCHICGKSVSSKTYLTVHVRKHTGEKPHVCDLCGKGFISQNYLSVHRRTHTGERPHQCPHCQKRFTQRTTLVVHLRSHTGDRPYPCTCCHKSFASKTMLNSHLKTHAKQNARQQQEHQTQLNLQQQNLLLSPEQEQQLQQVEPDSSSIVLIQT